MSRTAIAVPTWISTHCPRSQSHNRFTDATVPYWNKCTSLIRRTFTYSGAVAGRCAIQSEFPTVARSCASQHYRQVTAIGTNVWSQIRRNCSELVNTHSCEMFRKSGASESALSAAQVSNVKPWIAKSRRNVRSIEIAVGLVVALNAGDRRYGNDCGVSPGATMVRGLSRSCYPLS